MHYLGFQHYNDRRGPISSISGAATVGLQSWVVAVVSVSLIGIYNIGAKVNIHKIDGSAYHVNYDYTTVVQMHH